MSAGAEQLLDLDEKPNEEVNQIRAEVAEWRGLGYTGATATSRRLLYHWTDERDGIRPFFAQVEAIETLIWFTEVAITGPSGRDLRERIHQASRDYNDDIERLAVKMATGTGKTAVMGMTIAWHTLNAAAARTAEERARYFTTFVAITPGLTIKERLAELRPSYPENVYDAMNLVPRADRATLNRATVEIVNYHRFLRRDWQVDVSGDTKKLLRGHSDTQFESTQSMLERALRGVPGIGDGEAGRAAAGKVCVLNDEAHHCYLPGGGKSDDEKAAGVWFSALRALRGDDLENGKRRPEHDRLGAVYDFSATPIFIGTSSRKMPDLFPWVVSDFPLMDAIESGLVKVPRVPVAGNIRWRNIYNEIAEALRGASSKRSKTPKLNHRKMDPLLGDAFQALYDDYAQEFEKRKDAGWPTPPVFIVVANDIDNAQEIHRWLSGWHEPGPKGSPGQNHPGKFELFNNYKPAGDGSGWEPAGRLACLLVHSRLEDDDLGTGKAATALKNQAAHLGLSDKANAKDTLRGVFSTVGKPGRLGEQIRCVVSVKMLTEGWDARTVTHVFGFRAFGTQLLCEQVTGRALRRSNYDDLTNATGRIKPEFAEVLGVPFDFMTDAPAKPTPIRPPNPTYTVESVRGRSPRRIEFPLLTGYVREPQGVGIRYNPDEVAPHCVELSRPDHAELAGVTGPSKVIANYPDLDMRRQQALVRLTAAVVKRLTTKFAPVVAARNDDADDTYQLLRRRLFPEAFTAVSQWIDHPDVSLDKEGWGLFAVHSVLGSAADKIVETWEPDFDDDADLVTAQYAATPIGTTAAVSFVTGLEDRYPGWLPAGKTTTKSELNIAACHSGLEVRIAEALDKNSDVTAWARNYQLGWEVPYHDGERWRMYVPDFVARLGGAYEDIDAVHLIVEGKGIHDELDDHKHSYLRDWWIPAVANGHDTPKHLRNWRFFEITDGDIGGQLSAAIRDALR